MVQRRAFFLALESRPFAFFPFINPENVPGKSNSILTTQRYHQDFACNFALEYYPFDNQVSTFILIVLYLFGLVPI